VSCLEGSSNKLNSRIRRLECKLAEIKSTISNLLPHTYTINYQGIPNNVFQGKSTKIASKRAYLLQLQQKRDELRKFKPRVKDVLNERAEKMDIELPDLSSYKRILIQDLITIFRLRKVLNRDVKEFRILNFNFNMNSFDKNKKKVNESINAIMHFTILLSWYLDIVLPNPIYFDSKTIKFDNSPTGMKPMYLNESNRDDFLVALACLNFDIAYLCAAQDTQIGLEETADSLATLAKLCESKTLGMRMEEIVFLPYDLADVVDFHFQKVDKQLR
jgi:hypothetical protein